MSERGSQRLLIVGASSGGGDVGGSQWIRAVGGRSVW